MVNVKRLLPVGSVVRLREAKKCLMIFGICQSHKESTFDYIGVLWPEGNMGAETQILFSHDDVQDVVFTGYDNQERQVFIERLQAFYESEN